MKFTNDNSDVYTEIKRDKYKSREVVTIEKGGKYKVFVYLIDNNSSWRSKEYSSEQHALVLHQQICNEFLK